MSYSRSFAALFMVGSMWLAGCGELEKSAPAPQVAAPAATLPPCEYDKPGYCTQVKDGRLWVFRKYSREIPGFLKNGEPTISVSRIGAGPNHMTLRAPDLDTLREYCAAKSGFATCVRNDVIWVFQNGAPAWKEFQQHGDVANSVTREGAGPLGLTLKAPDAATLDAYASSMQ